MGSCSDFLNHSDVIYAFCFETLPSKNKYCVCVCPNEIVFFLINSNPYKQRPQASIKITPKELPCLQHDSYLDTGIIVNIEESEVEKAHKNGKVWPLPDDLRSQIKTQVEFHGILPMKYEQIVLDYF